MKDRTPRKWPGIAALRLAFLLHDLILSPCVYITLCRLTGVPLRWTHGLLGWMLPVAFLAIFALPYIASALLVALYLLCLLRRRFPVGETALFLVLLAVCLLGLPSVSTAFHAAMSV